MPLVQQCPFFATEVPPGRCPDTALPPDVELRLVRAGKPLDKDFPAGRRLHFPVDVFQALRVEPFPADCRDGSCPSDDADGVHTLPRTRGERGASNASFE